MRIGIVGAGHRRQCRPAGRMSRAESAIPPASRGASWNCIPPSGRCYSPNPWDLGSARLLAWLGFKALATTSGGFAASLGRLDGNVRREEAVAHAAAVAEATGLPVSGDFENGFADDPSGVADTVRLARDAGIAGCSVEDWSGSEIYHRGLAAERVAAAAEAAHTGPAHGAHRPRREPRARQR